MRSVEQEYRRLNETVVPDAQLIKETRALMLEEFSVEKVQARAKKRLMKKVASYVAVAAASALICVGVMTTLPRAKSEAPNESAAMEGIAEEEFFEESILEDAEVEESVAEETLTCDRADNELGQANGETMEYADINIYYVVDGELQNEVVEDAECSIDAIFALWAEKNGVKNVSVLMVDIQSGETSLGVHLDLSGEFSQYLDDAGMVSTSLSLTLGEYLNADGVILTVEGQPV